jgi:hypothetical protein
MTRSERMGRMRRYELLLSLNGKKYLCTDAAFILFVWIFSEIEIMDEISEGDDAKGPSWSFASI